jgi:hypothetical protein
MPLRDILDVIVDTQKLLNWCRVFRNEGMEISEEDIRRLWPTRYEHINVHGKFLFNVDEEMIFF